MEQFQWELTEDEQAQLKDRWIRRIGQNRILEALQRLEGYQAQQETAWWEGVILRLGIPLKNRGNLRADHVTGKVWVGGKVSSLDNRPNQVIDA